MRGEQTGFGLDPLEPADDHVTYSYVLVLVSAYVALILVSVFVMDWFIVDSTSYGVGPHSVDLWAATSCDPSYGCISAPLERLGYSGFRPFAVVTLWTTALAAAFVLARCGAFLLGRRVWPQISAFAFGMIAVCVATVLALAFDGIPRPPYKGITIHVTPAPFVLLAAHVVGLLAVAAAVRRNRRVRPDRAPPIPRARIVSG